MCEREREREREMIGRNCFVQKSFCAKKKNFIAQFIDVVFLLLRLRVPLDVSNNIVSEREKEGKKLFQSKKNCYQVDEINFENSKFQHRTLTNGGSITVQLVSSFTSLDLAASLQTKNSNFFGQVQSC